MSTHSIEAFAGPPSFRIVRIPALRDNYIWLLHDAATSTTAVVDPATAGPVEEHLRQQGWSLDLILNTHHHADHVGANRELKSTWGCTIIGPRQDAARIPAIDIAVGDGDTISVGSQAGTIFDVPGHTRGHIAYWFPDSTAAFVGDTLFAAGCGRMFEGTPEQFWRSLKCLRALPDETELYCAHEYTEANLRFALSVLPNHPALRSRYTQVQRQRQRGQATVPSTLRIEKDTNLFLRCDDPALADALGVSGDSPDQVFHTLRSRKDAF